MSSNIPPTQPAAPYEQTTIPDNPYELPNPYEQTLKTDDHGIPLAPPPPPIRRIRLSKMAILFIFTLAIIGFTTGLLLEYANVHAHTAHNRSAPATITAQAITTQAAVLGNTPTPIATSIPTQQPTTAPTPIPTTALVPPVPAVQPTPIPPAPTQATAPVPTAPPAPQVDANSAYHYIINQLDSNHSVSLQGSDSNWSGWPYAPEHNALVWTDTTPDGSYTVEVAVFNSANEAQADYQCMNNNQCSKNSYQSSPLQGTYNGKCFYMDNNYSGNGQTYSSYMMDELQAFNNVPGC
jgi:hypothetical protein